MFINFSLAVAHLNDQLQFSAQLISTYLDHQNNSTSKLRYKVHRMKSAFSLTSKRGWENVTLKP